MGGQVNNCRRHAHLDVCPTACPGRCEPTPPAKEKPTKAPVAVLDGALCGLCRAMRERALGGAVAVAVAKSREDCTTCRMHADAIKAKRERAESHVKEQRAKSLARTK